MARPPGHPERGAYLSWLAYYAGVIEPAGSAFLSGVAAGHPPLLKIYEDMCPHVIETLTKQPFLLGNKVSAVDLLLVSALDMDAQAFAGQWSGRSIYSVDGWTPGTCARPCRRRQAGWVS